MNKVCFQFDRSVPLDDAAMTLNLAKLAAEGLVAPALIRLHVRHETDPGQHGLVISGTGEAFDIVVQVFTALLSREIGEGSFHVRPTREVTRTAAAHE
jgi:hypothetical protein